MGKTFHIQEVVETSGKWTGSEREFNVLKGLKKDKKCLKWVISIKNKDEEEGGGHFF